MTILNAGTTTGLWAKYLKVTSIWPKYITVVKHGFLGGVGDHVLHPNRHGRVVAEISKVFGETDIALAELADIHSSKETFSAPDAPVSAFRNLADIFQLRICDFICMDTPYNGRCGGNLIKIDILQIPAEETRRGHRIRDRCLWLFRQRSRYVVRGLLWRRGLGLELRYSRTI